MSNDEAAAARLDDEAGPTHSIGVVGVGEIGAAMVEALLAGPHAGALNVVLSPRSAHRSRDLAARHHQVRVAADNQDVVDEADVVILAVLPQHIETVCGAIDFRAEQIVVGLAAGWAPSKLGPLVAPATDVCQLIPLPMIALHEGPLVLYPRIAAVEKLLEGCGTVVIPEAEEDIPKFSAGSAVMSAFFAAQRTMVEWFRRQGIDADSAKHYVTALFSGLAAEGMTAQTSDLAPLIPAHETPGGLNQQLRETLQQGGTFDALSAGLDGLLARLSG